MFKKWNITSFNGITVPAHVALKPLEYSVLPRVEWYVDLYHPIGGSFINTFISQPHLTEQWLSQMFV